MLVSEQCCVLVNASGIRVNNVIVCVLSVAGERGGGGGGGGGTPISPSGQPPTPNASKCKVSVLVLLLHKLSIVINKKSRAPTPTRR